MPQGKNKKCTFCVQGLNSIIRRVRNLSLGFPGNTEPLLKQPEVQGSDFLSINFLFVFSGMLQQQQQLLLQYYYYYYYNYYYYCGRPGFDDKTVKRLGIGRCHIIKVLRYLP